MSDEAYCKIYVDLESPVRVENDLQGLPGISFSISAAEARAGGIPVGVFVMKNKMKNKPHDRRQADDFLTWGVAIDIEPDDRTAGTDELVTTILEHFWSRGICAVAACDYEEDLPFRGSRILRRDEPQ
ncbi:hypothetical protein AB0I68_22505 [Streptomyces sp. NPDC050448]|uniref:hypothetical protein n=1 Tax=Streptomyces sp. NPDC050448 TaxID=3155404 RepID=UPI0034133371